ncbi:MAG: acyl carrier protein [Gemmatimonadetes bacterium]|nr:acyl carrier protein [Gemmatimonadota bacterium]MYA65199.1 acyl carrier protein [Gemmatimonadota bacterium]MYB99498.1 acyl carrier protein [Gemmatimonadota bacterium]MYH51831.1 acyl carrier protein [Gemmatimonadota bacterium]MYI46903.1 acyl carrier protein [Gemmatimonadota bacterium]
MSTTEARLRALAGQHLGLDREPNFDGTLAESGVSSLNAVAFMKLVEKEFNMSISADQWAGIGTLRRLVDHIDSA